MLHHLGKREKILVLVAVLSGMFLAALDQSIVGTALPRIVSEFNGLNKLSWVVTAYLLTSTIAVPISGKLSDVFGRRRVISIGIMIFILGSILTGLSWNMDSLIAFRALQGIGGGILFGNALAVIGDLYAPAERAKFQGLFGAVFSVSSVIGPLLGGWLTDNASWRWCFYINVPISIISLTLIRLYMPEIKHPERKQHIDYRGAALLAVALITGLLGLSFGGVEFAWGSWQIISLLVAGVAFAVWFVRWELKAHDPILPMSLFNNPTFRISMAMLFLVGLAMFGAIVYLPLFAQLVQGTSATRSGIILLPMVIGLTSASLLGGQLISRTGRYRYQAIFGVFLTFGAMLWLSTLNVASTHFDLGIRMFALGVGIGTIMPLFSLIIQNVFDQSKLGVVSASSQLSRNIGAVVGVAVMGSVLNHTLHQKLGNLSSDPFVQALNKSGHAVGELSANSLQTFLSVEGQARVIKGFASLPSQTAATMNEAFHGFVAKAQIALSQSITSVFLLAAIILVGACIGVFFLKETPLRKSNNDAPVEY